MNYDTDRDIEAEGQRAIPPRKTWDQIEKEGRENERRLEEVWREGRAEEVKSAGHEAAEKIGIYMSHRMPMALMPQELAGIAAIIERAVNEKFPELVPFGTIR